MPKLVIRDKIDRVELTETERGIRTDNKNFEFFESGKSKVITQDALGKKVTITIEW